MSRARPRKEQGSERRRAAARRELRRRGEGRLGRFLARLALWRRVRGLEGRVAELEELVARQPERRPMREYLGLRWARDEHTGLNAAYCNFCWHEGRDLPLEVLPRPEQEVVVLVCHHPSHGAEGLRLVRDADGHRWGERELEEPLARLRERARSREQAAQGTRTRARRAPDAAGGPFVG